ncbi:CBS domain-containing protein [Planococcus sp. N028]|uniref:CBS domain-containing protein n=2 Tax=Planococcus shixiaomingii TaxID=3058393 RepID=A0ABT8N1W4_9BACL|nr:MULTISPECIES: CBS domain-containing protein [unclassified Planococcus (in: firmicutes)]MDN7241657.1 CBS domain-containing protein [Planococcus sp. N028]WKA56777.1 CBS domain-containing protein [Planococcus sp. N022]
MMKVTEIMTTDVETCTKDTSIQEVATQMLNLDVGSIPIVDTNGGSLVGIITDRDIVIRGIAANFTLDTPVGQIISSELVTGTPDMDVEDAATLMADNQIRRLPICEGNKLLGVVSLGDIAVKDPTDRNAGAAIEDISKPSQSND